MTVAPRPSSAIVAGSGTGAAGAPSGAVAKVHERGACFWGFVLDRIWRKGRMETGYDLSDGTLDEALLGEVVSGLLWRGLERKLCLAEDQANAGVDSR